MSASWHHADFAARVGEHVVMRPLDDVEPGPDVTATLAACTDPVRSGDHVSYRVTFVAGPGAPRRQGLFLVDASAGDRDPVFLVPVREVGDGLEYEALFNQSVEKGSGA